MELKQGYKQTELGIIPKEWEVKSIDQIFSFYSTSNYSKAQMTLEGDVGCLHYGLIHAIKNSFYNVKSGIKYYVDMQQAKYEFVVDGDIVMVDASEDLSGVNKSVEISGIGNNLYISGLHTFLLRDRGFFATYFRGAILNSNISKTQMLRLAVGMKVYGVSKPQLKTVLLPIPPLSEQTAIANALSDMDALISQTEKLIEKKKAIKQGVMQESLKPKEGWVTKKLGDIGKTYGGLSGKSKVDFANGNAFYIPFMNVMSSPTINLNFFDSVYIKAGEKQNKAQIADLFFNGSSETPEEVGMCSVLTTQIDNLYLNSFCFGYRLNDTQTYNGLFLAYYFRSDFGRTAIFSLAQGATRYNLSKGNFLKLEIPLPEFQIQNEIAGCIADMDSELKKITIKLFKLKQQKQGMMQALLTGKIRLI